MPVKSINSNNNNTQTIVVTITILFRAYCACSLRQNILKPSPFLIAGSINARKYLYNFEWVFSYNFLNKKKIMV